MSVKVSVRALATGVSKSEVGWGEMCLTSLDCWCWDVPFLVLDLGESVRV